MWFAEPHPFPERGSPTGLSASGQQSYEGWSYRTSLHSTLITSKNKPNAQFLAFIRRSENTEFEMIWNWRVIVAYLTVPVQHLPGGTSVKPRERPKIRLPRPEHEQVSWFHAWRLSYRVTGLPENCHFLSALFHLHVAHSSGTKRQMVV